MPHRIDFDLIDKGKRGRLNQWLVFDTPIKGHEVIMPHNPCALQSDGTLTLGIGYTWDFGSGPAIDTPAMVIASAAHDAFCVMTDEAFLPWECRAQADKFFRESLKANGTGFARRWWCWAGVRAYSKFVAYHRRDKQ